MNANPYFVEILDVDGAVRNRTKLDCDVVFLGRGYRCDIILDDSYVAPIHARLERDETGALRLHDNASHNGILVNGIRAAALAPIAVAPDAVYTLGSTRLRVRSAADPVAPERLLERRPCAPSVLGAGLVAAFLALVGFEKWFAMIDEIQPIEIVVSMATALGVLLAWAGAWAAATRALKGRAHFAQHLQFAASAALAFALVIWAVEITAFSFNCAWLYNWQAVIYALVLAGILIGHLAVMAGGWARLTPIAVRSVAALCVGGIAVLLALNYQTHKRLAPGAFSTVIFPPSWRIASERSPEALIDRIRADKPALDALRKLNGDNETYGD